MAMQENHKGNYERVKAHGIWYREYIYQVRHHLPSHWAVLWYPESGIYALVTETVFTNDSDKAMEEARVMNKARAFGRIAHRAIHS